jgi:RimJ/RimL family protein N-acetyltransferase
MYVLLADERLWTFTDGGMPASIEALTARYAQLERRLSPAGGERWLNWIVRDAAAGVSLGFVQATLPKDGDSASIAYVIGRQFWGRGFAREAVGLMIDEIGAAFGVTSLTACVHSRNVASVALLERFGLRCVDETDPKNQLYAGPIVRSV